MNHYYRLMERSQGTVYRNALNKDGAVQAIINDVCFILEVSKEKLLEENRHIPYPAARRVISYALRKELGFTFQKIGGILNRDHSTIVHNVNFIKDKNNLGLLNQYPDERKALSYVLKGFKK